MSKSLSDRKAKLQAELKEIQKQEAEIQAKKDTILAKVVRTVMDDRPEFENQIITLLDETLKKQRERDLFDLPKASITNKDNHAPDNNAAGMSYFQNNNTENIA